MKKMRIRTDTLQRVITYVLGCCCILLGVAVNMRGIHILWRRAISQTDARVSTPYVIPTSTPTPTPLVGRIPILMYHYVEYVKDKGDTIRQSLDTTPYTFEQQLATLKDNGYTFLTAKEFGEIIDGKRILPKRPVLLTFDDGYRDFYTDVFPLLQKYQVKVTVYMIAGFVGYKNNMTEEQLKEVAQSGLVDVGAHTVHHVELTSVDRKTAEKELRDGKAILESLLGMPVVSFAYPDGKYNEAVTELLMLAGYTTAVTTTPGIINGETNRFALLRLRPGGRTGEVLLQYFDQSSFRSW